MTYAGALYKLTCIRKDSCKYYDIGITCNQFEKFKTIERHCFHVGSRILMVAYQDYSPEIILHRAIPGLHHP